MTSKYPRTAFEPTSFIIVHLAFFPLSIDLSKTLKWTRARVASLLGLLCVFTRWVSISVVFYCRVSTKGLRSVPCYKPLRCYYLLAGPHHLRSFAYLLRPPSGFCLLSGRQQSCWWALDLVPVREHNCAGCSFSGSELLSFRVEVFSFRCVHGMF